MKLTKKELREVKAGAGLTAALLNAIIKGVNSFMDIGRYLGSSVRRLVGKKACPLK